MRGNGSITKAGRDTWRICADTGKDPITGRRKRKTRRIHGKKADAQQALRELIAQVENGLDVSGAEVTFKEYAERWHGARVANGELAERTIEHEAHLLKHLYPIMGHLSICNITPPAIESALTALRKEKEERLGREISSTTLLQYYRLMYQVMKHAEHHDLILRNPCERVKPPKKAPVDRRALSADEAARFSRFVDAEERRIYAEYREKERRATERGATFQRTSLKQLHDLSNIIGVHIALATGARISEVLALQWENVDTEARTVKIAHAVTRKGNLKTTKSGKVRTIAIDAQCAERLIRWKERQGIELAKLSITQDGTTPVCCNDIGGFFRSDNFQGWWRAFRERAGFPALRFHELRHTQATQLLANGVDVKTVQERLGHASASTTLDLYAHALPERDRAAADLIGELLSEKSIKEARIIKAKSA